MSTELGPLLRGFFDGHLVKDVGATKATRESYRDAVKLYLQFLIRNDRKRLPALRVEDFTRKSVLSFLDHLETKRGNSRSTRNHRLTVLRSLAEYIGLERPDLLGIMQRITRIPSKRAPAPPIPYLEHDLVEQLLAAPTASDRYASRDRALLSYLYNSGARAQEASDGRANDLDGAKLQVRVTGKGRKVRDVDLWKKTVNILLAYLKERNCSTNDPVPLFPSARNGGALTRLGIYRVVRKYAGRLEANSKAFQLAHATPHTLRHTMVTDALDSTSDPRYVQSQAGHARLSTTLKYAPMTTAAKRRAMKATEPNARLLGPSARPGLRMRPDLMDYMDSI